MTAPLAGENPPLEGVKNGVDRESSALMKHGKTKLLTTGILWAGISLVAIVAVACWLVLRSTEVVEGKFPANPVGGDPDARHSAS